jgi:hypothetical protein
VLLLAVAPPVPALLVAALVLAPPAPVVPVASLVPVVLVIPPPPPQPGPAAQARASMKGISAAIRGNAREDEVGSGVRFKEIRSSEESYRAGVESLAQ